MTLTAQNRRRICSNTGIPELSRTARGQIGVVHRDQCRSIGLHRSYIRNQVDAQRWIALGDKVLLLQNSPPSRRQLMWIAVLDAGSNSALCSHTSLELAGFKPFAEEAKQIHLLIPRGAKVTRFSGVVVHESRRLVGCVTVGSVGPRMPAQ